MASPHVAGGLAIVLQRVNKEFPELTGGKKQELAKNLLMSTAKSYKGENGLFSSPRQQGAGVLNLYNALFSSAIVYGENNISSINLGSIKEEAKVNVTLKNISKKAVNYHVKMYLSTDGVEDGKYSLNPVGLGEKELGDYTINAGESKVITATIKISELNFSSTPYGNYLDGFIVFSSDTATEISIPFSGFIGDFANLSVLEDDVYTMFKSGKRPLYFEDGKLGESGSFTHLATTVKNEFVVLGSDGKTCGSEHLAISPNGDGINDYVRFYGTFLRTYKNFNIKLKNVVQAFYITSVGRR